jgi:hypothetical protein
MALVQQLQEKVSHLCTSTEKTELVLLGKINTTINETKNLSDKSSEKVNGIGQELDLKFKECS